MTTPDHLNRPDREMTADELRQKYYDPKGSWDSKGEHPRLTKFEWRQEVMCSATLRGYWDWVIAQIEEED